ncbi:MFS transporter [Pantoea tagorei]
MALVQAFFVVGYVLFEVPSNLFLYKVGARRWIARIMISWGITTCLMMFVQTEWQFYLLRFLIGAMEAGFAPGILYYLTVWFPSSFRGRVTSILFLASAFSGLVGAPLSGVVLGRLDGALGLEGWHWLFLLGGLPCILLGVLVLKCLTDRPAEARWLTDEEKLFLSARITHQNRHAHGHSLLAALKMPGFILLGFIYFLIQTASYGMNFWVPQLIRSTGISNPEILGLLSAIPYLCGAITMLLIGRFSDATGERRYFLAGLMFLTGTVLYAQGFSIVTL